MLFHAFTFAGARRSYLNTRSFCRVFKRLMLIQQNNIMIAILVFNGIATKKFPSIQDLIKLLLLFAEQPLISRKQNAFIQHGKSFNSESLTNVTKQDSS